MPEPSRSVLICATPRSGSYLLCEALRLTGRAGSPEEYLWRPNAERFAQTWDIDVDDSSTYRAKMLEQGTGSNGTFGCKVMWGYAATAARVLTDRPWGAPDDSSIDDVAGLAGALPNTTFVFMRRRDTIAQAVSYARAVQADAWAQLSDGSVVPRNAPVLDDASTVRRNRDGDPIPTYDFHQIDFFRKEIEAHNAAWQSWFDSQSITPLLVDYETLAAEFEATAIRVLDAAGVDTAGVTFGERRLSRQRDHVSRRWRIRYREDDLARSIMESA